MIKQQIESFDFAKLGEDLFLLRNSAPPDDFRTLATALATDFATEQNLKWYSSWLIPQAQARFAELPLEYVDGLISGRSLLAEIKKDPLLYGLLTLFKYANRGSLVSKQTDEAGHSALAPLIMAAFKKYKSIDYSSWKRDEIGGITETTLAESMNFRGLPTMRQDELLMLREQCLRIKASGKSRTPETAYAIYPPRDSVLYSAPKYCKYVVLQLWVCHPSNRNPYVICDLENWDNMPEPLVSNEPLAKPKIEKPQETAELPWWA